MGNENWNGVEWDRGGGLQTQPGGINHLAGVELGLVVERRN
jgi:hypothetical protein